METEKVWRKTYWGRMFLFTAGALLFWFLEFVVQYWSLSAGDLRGAFVRASALAGSTLIGAALFSSAIFKWFPRTARYWRVRRYLGVSGAVFVGFHALAVYYLSGFNFSVLYYSLNPFENPIVFGSLALPVFLVMALTSTDLAIEKLGGRLWKRIHRFVYIAYPLSILHFVLMRPDILATAPGVLLVFVTALALAGQVHWFLKIKI